MSLVLQRVGLNIGSVPLIRSFDLTVAAGEIVTIMGPSGCGKSSLLSFIAGDLPAPMQGFGEIKLNGLVLDGIPAERRAIGRLFQDDYLFPHMTVGENLMFGIASGPYAARRAMMQAGLTRMALAEYEYRPPHTLSGGQRARVALMRALLAQPKAMLLDEPFNKLDVSLRQNIRHDVFEDLKIREVPTLIVTHDISDAPTGSRILTIAEDGTLSHV